MKKGLQAQLQPGMNVVLKPHQKWVVRPNQSQKLTLRLVVIPESEPGTDLEEVAIKPSQSQELTVRKGL